MKTQYCRCKKCGRELAARASGGDWMNAIFPKWHKDNGKPCDGTWTEVEDFYDNPQQPKEEGR